jgi:hypothetical protein
VPGLPSTPVAAGKQLPSGILLAALARETRLDVNWLLTGQGEMLLPEGGRQAGLALPVADQPLSGPVADYENLLTAERVVNFGAVPRRSQYLLRVGATEPITKSTAFKVMHSDFLLMETDSAFFPPPDDISFELWAIRVRHRDNAVQLALVSSSGEEAGLHARTFDQVNYEPAPTDQAVAPEIVVLRRQPDGGYAVEPPTRRSGKQRGRFRPRQPRPEDHWEYDFPIEPGDLVARCVLLVRGL